MSNARAYVEVIIVNVLWGLSFIASKRALQEGFQPFSLALTRFAVASLLLLPALAARRGGPRFPRGKTLGRLLLSALLGITLYFLFEYGGLQRTGASTASLIIAAIPALSLLYGAAFKKKRYPPICYAGVAASLLGVFLIVSGNGDGAADSLIGDLYILGACLCWVLYLEVTNRLMEEADSLYVTGYQSLFGALTLLPCALFEGLDLTAVTPTGWWMAMYLAVLCSVLAYLLYNDAMRRLDPFRTAIFININPLAAVLGGVLLLGERLTAVQLIGGAVVLASIFFMNRSAAGKAVEV